MYKKDTQRLKMVEIAQLVTVNQRVPGSSPGWSAKKMKHLPYQTGKCFFVGARLAPDGEYQMIFSISVMKR